MNFGPPGFQTRQLSVVIVAGTSSIVAPTGAGVSTGIQMVIIQGCVKYQEKAALGLMSPHWVIRKHDYVTLTYRNIDDGWCICQF